MAEDNNHIIQKVSVSLMTGSKENQGHYSEVIRKITQQSVENQELVLDRVPVDTYFHIDTLNVEVNTSESELENLQGKIERALAEKLKEVLKIGDRKGLAETGNIATKVSAEKRTEQILVHFLKTGRLVWWATPQEFAYAQEHLDMLPSSEWVHFIRSLHQETPSVLKRYVKQWPENSVLETIRMLADEQLGSEFIVSLLNGISAIDAGFPVPDRVNNRIAQGLYEIVIGNLIYKKDERLITEHVIKTWLKMSVGDPNQQRMKLIELKKYLKRRSPVEIDYSSLLEQWSGHQPTGEERESTREEVNQKEEQLTSGLAESMSVQHSGIVLLHSYLPLLFKRLGYIENGSFRNQETRERAVCAIYYLATGESEFPEEELGLAKFLCNWSSGEPVNRFLQFSDYEKEECENLLLSVISHWKALKNTSVNGLRTSFLQREGILKQEAFGFTLYVEELTHDILLQRLPWSYSVVKLSWMSEMLSVQWRRS